jgi:hypothetical protein
VICWFQAFAFIKCNLCRYVAAVRGAAAAAGFGATDGGDQNIVGSGKLPLLWSAAGELKGACLTALVGPLYKLNPVDP